MLYMGQPINSSRNIRLLWIGGSKIDAKKSLVSPKPRWIPPPQGYVKMNVDAAVSKTSNGGALGVVCRREDGSFLGASALTIQGIVDPTILEAMACREALALAENLYLQKVVVASDCLTVIGDMEKPFEGSYSMILWEIKAKSQEFNSIVFKFENRFSNFEAHVVARSSVASEFGRQV
jgi:hypothetical protein